MQTWSSAIPDTIHPFYASHRGAMEAAMRQRLDVAETMLVERAHLSGIDSIRQEVMAEFGDVRATATSASRRTSPTKRRMRMAPTPPLAPSP